MAARTSPVAPTEPAGPAPRLSADQRRAALIDAAKALVGEVGPGRVTIGTVATRAGVTRALVYKHFTDKDDLLQALYRQEAERLDRQIAADVAAAPDGFEPKLRAFIGATLDAVEEHAPFFTPLREVGAGRGTRQDQRRWDRRTVDYFARRAADEFGVDLRTARSVIAVLFSGIRSLLSQMRSRPGAAQRRFLLDTYVDTALGAFDRLARRDPPTTPDP